MMRRMASLTSRPDGSYWVQLTFHGRRHTIRLGPVSRRVAETVRLHIADLAGCKIAGVRLDGELLAWLSAIEAPLHARLVRAGLAEPRPIQTLGELIAGVIDESTVKPATIKVWRLVERDLVAFWGADHPLRQITAEQAADFRRQLEARLSPVTCGKRLKQARSFFKRAVDRGWIDRNPFGSLTGFADANRARNVFVPAEWIEQVMQHVPSLQWRLALSLARYAALRCPSELNELRWSDVSWSQRTIAVRSPKTSDERIIPIFAELAGVLDEAWHAAPPPADRVFPEPLASNELHKGLKRYLKMAGITPWPRLFQNLRTSRETELADEYPIHVVTSWLGHSPRVAAKHYLSVRREHIERAAGAQKGPDQVAPAGPTH